MNESTVRILMKAMLNIQNTAHSRGALHLSQLGTLKMRFTILLVSNHDRSCCSTIKRVFLKEPHCTFDIKVLCCLCVMKEMLFKKSLKESRRLDQERREPRRILRRVYGSWSLAIIWIARSGIKYVCTLKVNLHYSCQTWTVAALHVVGVMSSSPGTGWKEKARETSTPEEKLCWHPRQRKLPSALHLGALCCSGMGQQVEIKNNRNIWDRKMSKP